MARKDDPAPNVPDPHETRDRKTGLKTGFFSLRARLLALLAFVLIPWLGLLLYTQSDERRAAVANVNRDALRLIHIVTSNQAAEIEAARQLLTSFAALPQLRSANSDACGAFLGEMLKAMPMYFNFGVAELDGTLRCSALPLRSRRLEAKGVMLGMQRAVDFVEMVVTLHRGDIVVFYTDGITERECETGRRDRILTLTSRAIFSTSDVRNLTLFGEARE